jgi:hypothetical protein
MEKIDYSTMPLEELKKKAAALKVVIGIFMGSIMVMLMAGIFITVKNKSFSAFSVLPLGFLPLLIINMNSLKQINKAIAEKEKGA